MASIPQSKQVSNNLHQHIHTPLSRMNQGISKGWVLKVLKYLKMQLSCLKAPKHQIHLIIT